MTPTDFPRVEAPSTTSDRTTDPSPADVVARLREAATSIRNDGTPAQVGMTAEECDAAADLIASLQARLEQPAQVAIKPLEWEDADEGMCTKWRAPALGGSYDLVAFEREDGFAVNFYWGRPLSYWFIQGDPDEWGPTGPKMFPTLDAAKAAAQADYETRIRSVLAPSPADGAVEALEAASHFIRDHYEPGIDSEYTLLQQVNAALATLKGDTP